MFIVFKKFIRWVRFWLFSCSVNLVVKFVMCIVVSSWGCLVIGWFFVILNGVSVLISRVFVVVFVFNYVFSYGKRL